MGFKIFVHAIRLVIGHLGVALRIGGLLYVVQFATSFAVAFFALDHLTSRNNFDPSYMVWLVPISVMVVVTNIWIAVAWHRYVLLDEMPGAVVARFNGDRIFAYFGKSLLLGLVAVPIVLVAGFAVAGVVSALFAAGAVTSGPPSFIIALVPLFLVYVPLAIILYRLALILPASAVGKPIRFGDAWSATRGASGTIVGLAILSVLCIVLLDLPTSLLQGGPLVWVGLVWQTLIGWVEVMVGVSILTSLYGHYVEKRPIS